MPFNALKTIDVPIHFTCNCLNVAFLRNSSSYSSQSEYSRHRMKYEYRRKNFSDNQQSSNLTPMNASNHYDRLNLSRDASLDAIKSSYYSLTKNYHPDIVGHDDKEAVRNFQLITESYDILSDTDKKREYDISLSAHENINDFGLEINNLKYNRSQRENPKPSSEVIFKMRRDLNMMIDKANRPEKYRAGVFKRDPYKSREDIRERLRRLEQFSERVNKNINLSSDPFYSTHLEHSIRRSINDLKNAKVRSDYDEIKLQDPDISTILTSSVIILAIVLFGFYQLDGSLDTKLVSISNKSPTDEKEK